MKILFIGSYPNPVNPYMSIFFRALIYKIADLGVECHVLSPVSRTKYRDNLYRIPEFMTEYTERGSIVKVYHPRTWSFSAKKIGKKDFIVGFVGYFIERKGSDRLLEACRGLPGVSLAFAGSGKNAPSGSNVVFCKSLPHEDVSDFLNAIDVFVLPTRNEGCSNAIIEAMACGNAIVSSNLSFNLDILNNSNSILINPNNIEEIRRAVIELRDNMEKRIQLSKQVLEDAEKLSLDNRAILSFIMIIMGILKNKDFRSRMVIYSMKIIKKNCMKCLF